MRVTIVMLGIDWYVILLGTKRMNLIHEESERGTYESYR